MPTQKTFKHRVRTRMAKSGESYTAARVQLLRKAGARASASAQPVEPDTLELPTSDEVIHRATGRSWQEWFALLDSWGAAARRHPEIARWLREEHHVDGWYAQSVTVGYERARGMRAKHQLGTGFSVTATKTVNVPADRLLAAFNEPRLRRRWLPEGPMRRRPTRAANSARFDWADPASLVVVTVLVKGAERGTVSVTHERLPDAEAAESLKGHWRDKLSELKVLLEHD